ncbi:MAG: electron transfer flavoprotein subunit beta/FixA family protein, partial [bacterium]
MNIAVLVKLVPDTEATLRIDESRQRVSTGDINFVLNPYDEFAIEEALRIKEKFGAQVTLFSLGGEEAVKALRQGLAMGADEAVHILPSGKCDMLGVAKGIAEALKEGDWDIIWAGKQAVDDDCSAIGSMVAELLGIPHVSTVVKWELTDGKAIAHREVEGGLEIIECPLPALFTAQKGL